MPCGHFALGILSGKYFKYDVFAANVTNYGKCWTTEITKNEQNPRMANLTRKPTIAS